jgi:hypothetical protein
LGKKYIPLFVLDNHLNEDVTAMTGGGIPPFKLCEMIAVLPIHYRLTFFEGMPAFSFLESKQVP